jgi:ribosomal protein L34E
MSENICIPKSYFLIIFALIIVLTYFHGVRMKNILPTQNYKAPENKVIILQEKKYNKNNQKSTDSPLAQKIKTLRKRDVDSAENTFKPPERRLPRHSYPNRSVKQLINIPTRGYPDDYHNIGMLVRKNDEKVLKLFGRQKFPGSNQWEYYVIGNDPNGLNNKIPLSIPGNKELFSNDTIAVPWLDQSKGKFELKLFDYDAPRYNPFIFN